jgi:hypothetical protein
MELFECLSLAVINSLNEPAELCKAIHNYSGALPKAFIASACTPDIKLTTVSGSTGICFYDSDNETVFCLVSLPGYKQMQSLCKVCLSSKEITPVLNLPLTTKILNIRQNSALVVEKDRTVNILSIITFSGENEIKFIFYLPEEAMIIDSRVVGVRVFVLVLHFRRYALYYADRTTSKLTMIVRHHSSASCGFEPDGSYFYAVRDEGVLTVNLKSFSRTIIPMQRNSSLYVNFLSIFPQSFQIRCNGNMLLSPIFFDPI